MDSVEEIRVAPVELVPLGPRLGQANTEDSEELEIKPSQASLDQVDETDQVNPIESIETLATSPIICLRRALKSRDEKRDKGPKQLNFLRQ